ncbi:MAG: PQQ-binding-like beta-propeller repeat protein [Actinomycetota bacterium]|nr:PQQ-binding-like beta-propeller repeat protein [Actinomycetota bacterium]
MTVSGRGFPAGAHLEVFLDRTDVGSATAGPRGRFGSLGVGVQVTAVTGRHWVTVIDPATGAQAQRSFLIGTPWMQARATPGLTGLNAAEGTIGSLNASTLAEAWRATLPGPSEASPAVDGAGQAFVVSAGRLARLPDHCSGTCSPAATVHVPGAVSSSPALLSGSVFVATKSGLRAYPESCTQGGTCRGRWIGRTDGAVIGSPTAAGAVFVAASDHRVYAFPSQGCGAATAACSPLWKGNGLGPISGQVAAGYGGVYVASTNGLVTAFASGTGDVLWRENVGEPVASSPVVAQQPWSQPAVYVVGRSGTLHVMNAYRGTPLWTGAAGETVASTPAVAYGDLYVATEAGTLAAFSTVACKQPPCAPAWTAPADGSLTAPTVANGVVYVGSDSGTVFAFNARSGARLGSVDLRNPIRAPLVVGNGTLYASASDGTLVAFRPAGVPPPPHRPNPRSLRPAATPIRHVVVVFQENHSFDDTLGALCVQDSRCDGAITGRLADGSTVPLATASDLVPEVDHTAESQSTAVDGGKMDGFSRIEGCQASTGYACYINYQPTQIPNLTALARAFVISDRTFETDSVASWGSHLDLAAGQMDGFTGAFPFPVAGVPSGPPTWGCDSNWNALWHAPGGPLQSVPACVPKPDRSGPYVPSPVAWVPTIMDRLDAAGLSWRIYSGWGTWSMCPSFADCIYGPQRADAVESADVLQDAAAGRLPNLSFVIPSGANSQHNGWSMLQGDNWIGSVVSAIEHGPEWRSTAIFIAYDDCGCFYDHVPPPPGLGIRVPMVIVSPYARPGFTDSNVASYSSMLAYAEHVFGLPPLYSTDANAYDYGASFDYGQVPLRPVALARHPIPTWERRLLRSRPPERDET